MPIIDGRALAAQREEILQKQVASIKGPQPCLAIILVGTDERSRVYVRTKLKKATKIGISTKYCPLEENISQTQLERAIEDFNKDESIHAIILQLPLPPHLDSNRAMACISPLKDVDGVTPQNVGALVSSGTGIAPATPRGILTLIKSVQPKIEGLHAVVIGRSNIVGKPLQALLLQENCTVTQAHSYTKELYKFTKQADIVISATGRAQSLDKKYFKEGTIIIDVGISGLGGKLYGDVAHEVAESNDFFVTPVPGGVGPMTIAFLMENTLQCYKLQVPKDER